MRINDEVINEIRESADIVDIIGNYIPLTKKGRSYTAVCPFHDDHDPSLSISKDKQIYKCFVCGNGGNVFTFVMNYKKCTFIEAVIEVAKLIGKPLNIEYENKPKLISKYQKYYDIMNETVKFTNYILNTYAGESALEYLNNRGLEKEVIDFFDIGYNPNGNALYNYLKTKNFNDEDLDKINVCRMSNQGMRDVFYDRITFPIHDINGNPIAFSARSMDKNNSSKYINTSSTMIYIKGDVIYNYHRAKEEVKKAKRVIVCEGVMDVIAFKRADIGYSVATLGTAMTIKQFEILKSLSPHIIFCYDGDKAGQAATFKAIEIALNYHINPGVIVNSTNKDPDEILNNGKAKDLQNFVSNEISGIEFAFEYLKKLYPLNNYTNRKEYHLRLSNMINMLDDAYDRDNFFHELQVQTGLTNPKEIKKNTSNLNKPIIINNKNNKFLDGVTKAEYFIISQMMISKKAVEIYRRELYSLIDETNNDIASVIIEEYRKNGMCTFAKLVDSIKDDRKKQILIDIATNESLSNEYEEAKFLGAIDRIKKEIQRAKAKNILEKMKNEFSEDEQKKLLNEYASTIRILGGKHAKNN